MGGPVDEVAVDGHAGGADPPAPAGKPFSLWREDAMTALVSCLLMVGLLVDG